jgi:hypothetical protein
MSSGSLQGAKNAASLGTSFARSAKQDGGSRHQNGIPIALVFDSGNNRRELHTKFIHNGKEQGGMQS